MELEVPLPRTPDGRVYRFSPNENAKPRHFVMGNVNPAFVIRDEARPRMKLSPRSKQTICPYSGVIAPDDEFIHPDDVEAAYKAVEHAALADVESAIHDMFVGLERKFSSSKVMKITAGPRPSQKPKPRFIRRDLLRELVCDHCGRDYGVYAIGLFCPDCGAPNLRLHFAREVQIVERQVALADAQDGQEELAYRLMGNAHEDVLTAFEATLKAVYQFAISGLGPDVPQPKPIKNEFQSVGAAQRRFSELGLDPFAGLAVDEMETLKLNIQKRHIIGHNLGVMDEKFADFDEDARIGETVRLVGEEITQFAAIAYKVVDALDTWLAGGIPSPFELPLSAIEMGVALQPAVPHSEQCRDLGLSELAVRVGRWVAEQSTSGMDDFVDNDVLVACFSDVAINEIDVAIAELSADGYVQSNRTMAHVLPTIRPTADLFATFDPLIGLGDPVADSLTLAEQILDRQCREFGVDHLHELSGWPRRRFNPALGLLVPLISEERASKEMQNTYPVNWFAVGPEEIVAFKRYVAQRRG
jgi:hypothetical protein